MSVFYIKIIAIVTMVIDHIGAFLLPDVFFLRVIGRLSFLLFAWLLANGAHHTRNINTYTMRLFLFALISQVPFLLIHRAHDPNSWELNIFFTLFLGLLAIIVLKRIPHLILRIVLICGIGLIAERFSGGFSYGAYGVVTVLIFYVFNKNLKAIAALQTLAIFVFFTIPVLLSNEPLFHLYQTHKSIALIQPLALISLLALVLYNGKEGPKTKRFFYFFYPVHLAIIYIIMLIT